MTQFPRASELPWLGLGMVAAMAVGVHLLVDFIDVLARPAGRSPAAPASVSAPVTTVPVAPVIVVARPPLPPPHATREELSALVRFLKAGGTLPPEHVGELANKGVYIRGRGASTFIVTAPGYLR